MVRTRSHEHCEHGEPTLSASEKRKLSSRLRRIEGQIRGIQRMVEEERYCPDILMQMSATGESLRASAQVLLHSHLRGCVTEAVRSRSDERAEEVYEELMDLFRKYAR
jgi:CsoR family transcriptional regulator, copper-sensing transcriptional repressor